MTSDAARFAHSNAPACRARRRWDGGHKTESIYRRYAIQDEAMLREAAAKLDTWVVEQRAKADAERKGQLKRFKKRQTA
jgi:hypothetical protein